MSSPSSSTIDDTALALNPHLDRTQFSEAFARAGRVHIPTVLTDAFARRVHHALEHETPWGLILNDGKKVLERISKETGGRLFEVTKKETVDQIYDQIQQELRAQYILGYIPDKSPVSGDYHKIHLATKQKELIVQSRDGYYVEPSPAGAPDTP